MPFQDSQFTEGHRRRQSRVLLCPLPARFAPELEQVSVFLAVPKRYGKHCAEHGFETLKARSLTLFPTRG